MIFPSVEASASLLRSSILTPDHHRVPDADAELADLAELPDDQLSDRIRERFTERPLTEAAVSALADLVRLEVELRRAEMNAQRTDVDVAPTRYIPRSSVRS